jgi:hypothetical protein
MPRVKFVFAIHCHQPVGNFDFVFEDSYNRCYHPFLKTLNDFPDFKCCLHYTGILLDWIEKNRPEHFDMIKNMVSRGQLEMLGGGFYEPIFAVIPDEDKVGQIIKLSRMIESKTGKPPRGMWLAERLWEPHLPSSLSRAGMEYVVVDDTHFKYSGLDNGDLDGYYISEEIGETLRIFPSSKFLRYSIPFKDAGVSVDYIKSYCENSDNPVVVYADDAEKFGIWPGTHELCYEEKWLPNFMESILKAFHGIQPAHFSEVIDSIPPKGNIYLPTASYAEMMEWALPAKATKKYRAFEEILESSELLDKYGIFVRGGFWRNFLSKYPESNNIHKKMLWVHRKIKEAEPRIGDAEGRRLLESAVDEKRKGQCNDPYWHGVFGGLYLNNLRNAVYKHLIAADKLVDAAVKSSPNWIDVRKADFDRDGRDELIAETPSINIFIAPAHGGSIFELDYKPIEYNLCNNLTRREEAYHQQIIDNVNKKPVEGEAASIHDMIVSKEKGLEKHLKYDWYRRAFMLDHFFGDHANIDNYMACAHPEQGDFVNTEYELDYRTENNSLIVTLSRNGHVWVGSEWCPVTVVKDIEIDDRAPALNISYSITNNHIHPIPLRFGPEFNLSMLDGRSDDRYYFIEGREITPRNLASVHQLQGITGFGIEDRYLKLRCSFILEEQSEVWLFPVETVSLSEAGFEKVYQSSAITPHWGFHQDPGETRRLKIRFAIESL